jgi:hypothetical protein
MQLKRRALGTVLTILVTTTAAISSPIAFTFVATGTGTLGMTSFSGATVTITATGDTGARYRCFTSSGVTVFCDDSLTPATVTISGIGTATFTNSAPGDFGFAFVVQEQELIGFGVSKVSLRSVVSFAPSPSLLNYSLASAAGPIGFTGLGTPGGGAGLFVGQFSTSLGPLTFTSSGSTGVFAATTPGPGQVAVFRSTGGLGTWALDNGDNVFDPATDKLRFFGLAGDQPVAGDWTGNGQIRLGVFRNGQWFLDLNNNGQWDGVAGGDGIFSFGLPGDQAIVGDWNGDGRTKLGVFRCPTPTVGLCTWIIDAAGKFAFDPATAVTLTFGLTGDKPVVNNWSGTGKVDQIGVFRNGTWIVDSNGDGQFELTDAQFSFGLAGDLPVVGNWNSSGQKRIGIFRPSTGFWVLDSNGNNAFDVTDQVVFFGLPGDLAAVGTWTMP